MNKSEVFVNEQGVIEIIVRGPQTIESVQYLGDEALKISRKLRTEQKPALILDNLLEMGIVPPEARKRVVELIKSTDYDRLAMVGSNPMIRFGANLMLQATGKGTKVRYFDEYEAALAWLREGTE